MEIIEMNKKAITVLEQWDPFQAGKDAYEHEIIDVVAALQRFDHPVDLAKAFEKFMSILLKFGFQLKNAFKFLISSWRLSLKPKVLFNLF